MNLIHIVDADNRKHYINPKLITAIVDHGTHTTIYLTSGTSVRVNLTVDSAREMIKARTNELFWE